MHSHIMDMAEREDIQNGICFNLKANLTLFVKGLASIFVSKDISRRGKRYLQSYPNNTTGGWSLGGILKSEG